MKRKILLLAVTVLFLLGACGCAATKEDTNVTESPDAAYLTRIAELEALLQKEREDKYISDLAYKKQIEALQKQLASETPPVGGEESGESVFRYTLKDGKAVITGFAGDAPLLNIPATLDGYPVIAIGERAFEGTSPVAITVPEGVEEIGWFAFYGCATLTDVTLPASIRSIGYAVFDGCPRLTLICPDGSYAAQYAESFGLSHISQK